MTSKREQVLSFGYLPLGTANHTGCGKRGCYSGIGEALGEKLHEELFYDSEEQHATSVGGIMQAKSTAVPWDTLTWHLNALHTLIGKQAHDEIRARVKHVIPEYVYLSPTVADSESDDISLLPVPTAAGD